MVQQDDLISCQVQSVQPDETNNRCNTGSAHISAIIHDELCNCKHGAIENMGSTEAGIHWRKPLHPENASCSNPLRSKEQVGKRFFHASKQDTLSRRKDSSNSSIGAVMNNYHCPSAFQRALADETFAANSTSHVTSDNTVLSSVFPAGTVAVGSPRDVIDHIDITDTTPAFESRLTLYIVRMSSLFTLLQTKPRHYLTSLRRTGSADSSNSSDEATGNNDHCTSAFQESLAGETFASHLTAPVTYDTPALSSVCTAGAVMVGSPPDAVDHFDNADTSPAFGSATSWNSSDESTRNDDHCPSTFQVSLAGDTFASRLTAPVMYDTEALSSICAAGTVMVGSPPDAVDHFDNADTGPAFGAAYSSNSSDETVANDDHCRRAFQGALDDESFSFNSTALFSPDITMRPSACPAGTVTISSSPDAVDSFDNTYATPVSGTTSVLSVDDVTPPTDCETIKKYAEQEVHTYFKLRYSRNNDRSFSDNARSADCSFNDTGQPEDACGTPCFSDGVIDSSSSIEQEASYDYDSGCYLKDTGKDIVNSSDTKSVMMRFLSLHKLLDFQVTPTPVVIYTLHSSESISEQDYVRNLMALPPEEREALMRNEAERLRTYGSGFWPIRDVMPPEELAAAGFYYTGVHDRVQCAFCRGVLRNWERGDSAMNEHRVHFSYCRLVMGLDCGNIPIASGRPTGENTYAAPSRGGPANLFATTDRPLNDVPDHISLANLAGHVNGFLATMGSGEPLPGVSTEKPKHPEHAVEARRLQSFGTWPLWALQSPENLAKAGFYYAGFGDSVKCFYCDGGLRNWEIMDNPWEEHARWFKECKYLLDVKGQAYVDEIQKKYTVGNEAARLVVTQAAATSKTSPGSSLEHPSVQLVKSLGYSESQIMAALERFYTLHQTSTMPKGAELLDVVLHMEDEASGARPALSEAGRSLPTGRVPASTEAAVPFAVAASRPSETASVPAQFTHQRPQPDGISAPNIAAHSNRAAPDVKRQPEPPPSERPLASLHDIIFTGLLDLPDGEARCVEENRQMHKHLECKGCRQQPAEVVLLPCGHFSSCLECVPSLRNCPVCATVVRGTIRTYLC